MNSVMRAGFAKVDITPRVGVELCGFGPYLNRHSVGVRDRLWARAAAFTASGKTAVVVACDLVGVTRAMTARVRARVAATAGLPEDAVMISCSHTHSGPNTANLIGWGDADEPYRELLPGKIAAAALAALADQTEAELSHAESPCPGIGLNREYDIDAPPLEEVLRDDWRPAKPELTDTTTHVLAVRRSGKLVGWLAYFGCHPVVCCQETRYIHGDYCGVAMGNLEREHPGAIGLFLQGAQGDVNSCVVHKPELDALLALDVIAGRFARAVRAGLSAARPVAVDEVRTARRLVDFSRRPLPRTEIERQIAQEEAFIERPEADERDYATRMAIVRLATWRRFLAGTNRGEALAVPVEVQGVRLGPVALLGAPFEIMQAIKNDVTAAARTPLPLVMGIVNDLLGYAPDRTCAARGGYAADQVPLMVGTPPFSNIHDELVAALSALDAELAT